jgi:hypothetical protein
MDFYGIPIGLRHQGHNKYTSSVGGAVSLLMCFSVIGYFMFLVKDVWNFENTIKNSIIYRNLAFDETKIELTTNIFDFAATVTYSGLN